MTAQELDFVIENHGTICLLYPHTDAAEVWCQENIPHATTWGVGGRVVEPRYMQALVEVIEADGLVL